MPDLPYMPFSATSLESPCCIVTGLALCAPLMWQRMTGEWCWKPHTQYMMRNDLSHLPPGTPFSPIPSRWKLPCKKTGSSESCPQNFLFLPSIMWAALIDSPVGSLMHNIQLIGPRTTSWKWLGKFLFTFFHRPHSGEIPDVSACTCCSLLGQLGTAVRKLSSRHLQDPQTHDVCERAAMATCTWLQALFWSFSTS